jgi:DNA-binding CsgD family transcriptional regulator
VGEKQGHGIDQLSAAQVETLRHVFAHRSSKEIARIMGVSPHTVDERVRRAIRLLGVTSRIEAARIVESAASEPYQPLIYQAPQLGGAALTYEEAASGAFNETPNAQMYIGFPFPTRGRPHNTHGLRERVLWPMLIAFGTIMAFAALYAVLLGLGAMLS